MTKKEKAAIDAEIKALKLRLALVWTPEVEPDVPPPVSSAMGQLSVGYLPGWQNVEPACSSSVHHGFGRQDRTTTQGSRSLFSTRVLALRAMRNQAERKAAEELYRIDRMIEKEIANTIHPAPVTPDEKES